MPDAEVKAALQMMPLYLCVHTAAEPQRRIFHQGSRQDDALKGRFHGQNLGSLGGRTLKFSVYSSREGESCFSSLCYLELGWIFTASLDVFNLEVLGESTRPR